MALKLVFILKSKSNAIELKILHILRALAD